MSNLNVHLVAADRKVWEGEATALYAKTVEGEIGILPDHTPLLSVLADSAEVRIDPVSGSRQVVTVGGGFISVDHNTVTVVSDSIDASGLTA
ncbi:F0F1 ATP synthase subunit epsilon [Yimella sp. cx-51]|uniref:F0F1 ATP synthase subunit epsilon n=1 Tax=Yimella sp. cx-51 TaxID=2770551 RepID=UPI00165EBC12|nr:F0F1 ATP synthase subunit epsilon [Yimella sp. cx-51]MBC9957035.1 F0F1 ATP synthase subunit epsilon [Yimella sp. cx-51]MBD2758342.1 F0F1 ATP synthase subunit epsilon [Yimella sp. cx-573]QTH37299.1 F0F1 ATP synthase subunit epsilon [Yimella sp. cx-51]